MKIKKCFIIPFCFHIGCTDTPQALLDLHPSFEFFQDKDAIQIRYEKNCGHANTDGGNFDGLRKFNTCSS